MKLAAAATALKPGGPFGPAPFSLALFTDLRSPTPAEAIMPNLPPGAAVVFRDYGAPDRARRALELLALARARGLLFLVSNDITMASRLGAEGVHLPAHAAARLKARPPLPIVSVAAHDVAETAVAARLGADLVFLSPVFATASHPGAATMGAAGFARLARIAGLPALALGGLDEQNAALLAGAAAGFGAIDAFTPR